MCLCAGWKKLLGVNENTPPVSSYFGPPMNHLSPLLCVGAYAASQIALTIMVDLCIPEWSLRLC